MASTADCFFKRPHKEVSHPGNWYIEERSREGRECTSKFKRSLKRYIRLCKKNMLFRQLALGENDLCLRKLLNQPSSVEGEGWKE